MSSVGIDEYHGCPFKHYKSEALKNLLLSTDLPHKSMDSVSCQMHLQFNFVFFFVKIL